ncbi:hypothetical protein ATANTOWER_011327 [Ataeniobius toweri]|uniref:Uncharacterized protein n=1 Tax=Ataeniobius toweri TaxID=208326 RepID=A0ABU7B7Q9_9TELE|nr:hypothetical protein [Ataeniobius toweri]
MIALHQVGPGLDVCMLSCCMHSLFLGTLLSSHSPKELYNCHDFGVVGVKCRQEKGHGMDEDEDFTSKTGKHLLKTKIQYVPKTVMTQRNPLVENRAEMFLQNNQNEQQKNLANSERS